MTEIKIDKNVPIPAAKGGRGKPCTYPWLTMEVGDSFLMPSRLSKGSTKTAAGSASRRYAPRRFTSRKTPEGIRIWRVA